MARFTKDERIRYWRGLAKHWRRKYFDLLSKPHVGGGRR